MPDANTLESRREMFIGSIYNKLRGTGGDRVKKPVRVLDRAATDPLKEHLFLLAH